MSDNPDYQLQQSQLLGQLTGKPPFFGLLLLQQLLEELVDFQVLKFTEQK